MVRLISPIRKNKRGWMRILEATIAVMIVSGVLVVVYSKQVDRKIAPAEYFFKLQRHILSDIYSRTDLRLAVLNSYNDSDPNDGNFSIISDFIGGRTPGAFNYSLRICDLGDETDRCKMKNSDYIATLEKDVFVEDTIISADLGDGTNAVYTNGKKLRFFIWELR